MKKYEFVNVKMGGIFSSRTDEHRKVINEYAAKGYSYNGMSKGWMVHISVTCDIYKIQLGYIIPRHIFF